MGGTSVAKLGNCTTVAVAEMPGVHWGHRTGGRCQCESFHMRQHYLPGRDRMHRHIHTRTHTHTQSCTHMHCSTSAHTNLILEMGNKHSKLGAPVADMVHSHDVMAHKLQDTRDGIADDCGAQVTNVHLLGNVG